MNGLNFYEFLMQNYSRNGQPLYGHFTFCDWLFKRDDGTFSFRFNIRANSPKSIRRDILIAAWDANQRIDDNWLNVNFSTSFHNDCRLRILNFIIEEHRDLR